MNKPKCVAMEMNCEHCERPLIAQRISYTCQNGHCREAILIMCFVCKMTILLPSDNDGDKECDSCKLIND